jgi:hypothetical protein
MYIPNIYNCQQKDQKGNLGRKMWGVDACCLASLFSSVWKFCGLAGSKKLATHLLSNFKKVTP